MIESAPGSSFGVQQKSAAPDEHRKRSSSSPTGPGRTAAPCGSPRPALGDNGTRMQSRNPRGGRKSRADSTCPAREAVRSESLRSRELARADGSRSQKVLESGLDFQAERHMGS